MEEADFPLSDQFGQYGSFEMSVNTTIAEA